MRLRFWVQKSKVKAAGWENWWASLCLSDHANKRQRSWWYALYLSQQLWHDFDLLATSQQWAQRNAGDAGHLDVVDDRHEFLKETQWQVGVFQAVDGQSTPRLVIAILSQHVQISTSTFSIISLLQKGSKQAVLGCCAFSHLSTQNQPTCNNSSAVNHPHYQY